mmetsp:Transcript_22356/g.65923  ORF Transcript_22356/g.65923 Transcript_22356/m.65923 type:complete len:205 (-) Transcript_22356:724-1338(-)
MVHAVCPRLPLCSRAQSVLHLPLQRSSVLHLDAIVPTEAHAAPYPDALTQGVWPEDVDSWRQAIRRIKVLHRLDRRAVQDAQALLGRALVGLGRSAVRDGEIVDEDHVTRLVGVGSCVRGNARGQLLALRGSLVRGARGQAGVEHVVVLVEKLAHLVLLKEAQLLLVRALVAGDLEHTTRHAKVEVDALPAGDGVLVHHRVQHA